MTDPKQKDPTTQNDLIVTIVGRGENTKIVKAARAAGAQGATIIPGRGTGVHEQRKLLGIAIEPEKDVVLIVVKREISEQVLQAVVEAGSLDEPATGIAFVVELSKVVGITHLLRQR
ncbi:MAG: P-II family nitrogen regulator [Bacillota bacterium]